MHYSHRCLGFRLPWEYISFCRVGRRARWLFAMVFAMLLAACAGPLPMWLRGSGGPPADPPVDTTEQS